jgi:hypothetical protein
MECGNLLLLSPAEGRLSRDVGSRRLLFSIAAQEETMKHTKHTK